MQRRMGSDFKVSMGYGLHIGWCIQGAIGTMHKIDCTYISRHVELADQLEGLTRMYGCDMIVSEAFMMMASETLRGLVRLVDRIEAFSFHPFNIYTFDLTTPPANASFWVELPDTEDDDELWATFRQKVDLDDPVYQNFYDNVKRLHTDIEPEFYHELQRGME